MDNEVADLDKGARLLKEGKMLDALKLYGKLLDGDDSRPELYRSACDALVASASAESAFQGWALDARQRFLAALLLQESFDEHPPILHHSIGSLFTSGAGSGALKISEVFAPAIENLLQSKQYGKNLVLLILLLRESLGRTISQKNISALHLAWISKFSFGDLTIPYNCMFDKKMFWRNRDDITSKLLPRISNDVLFDGFSLGHIVFFEWLSQRDIRSFAGEGWLDKLKARLHRPISNIELAAARSLFVRHFPHDSKAALHEQFSKIGEKSLEVAVKTASIRGELRALSRPVQVNKRVGVRLFNNRLWQGAVAARSLASSRLWSVAGSRRRLKVAVCVSGQLRGYDRTFNSWKRTLLRDVQYDIFVHSWAAVGRSGAEPFRYVLPFEGRQFTDTYKNLCLQIGFEDFKARYPSLFSKLAETGRVTEQEVSEFYGTPHVRLDDDSRPPFSQLTNSEKMHCKIEKCFGLVRESGREYDLMIRLRPDKPVKYLGFRWDDLGEICQDDPVLFSDFGAGVHYANPMIGDQFAVGAPRPMEIYSSTFSSYPRLAAGELLNCKPSITGHVSLAQVCWTHGIEVKKVPIHFGRLQEPSRLSTRMVSECLEVDAAGRMDGVDRQLIAAAAADMAR